MGRKPLNYNCDLLVKSVISDNILSCLENSETVDIIRTSTLGLDGYDIDVPVNEFLNMYIRQTRISKSRFYWIARRCKEVVRYYYYVVITKDNKFFRISKNIQKTTTIDDRIVQLFREMAYKSTYYISPKYVKLYNRLFSETIRLITFPVKRGDLIIRADYRDFDSKIIVSRCSKNRNIPIGIRIGNFEKIQIRKSRIILRHNPFEIKTLSKVPLAEDFIKEILEKTLELEKLTKDEENFIRVYLALK